MKNCTDLQTNIVALAHLKTNLNYFKLFYRTNTCYHKMEATTFLLFLYVPAYLPLQHLESLSILDWMLVPLFPERYVLG